MGHCDASPERLSQIRWTAEDVCRHRTLNGLAILTPARLLCGRFLPAFPQPNTLHRVTRHDCRSPAGAVIRKSGESPELYPLLYALESVFAERSGHWGNLGRRSTGAGTFSPKTQARIPTMIELEGSPCRHRTRNGARKKTVASELSDAAVFSCIHRAAATILRACAVSNK